MIFISTSGGKDTVQMLILSQVVLSMQLSFANFPLMMFTCDRKKRGEFVNSWPTIIIGYLVCTVIAAQELFLLGEPADEIIKLA